MTIDEAIAHAREVAKRNREQWKNCPAERDTREHLTCEECAEEHEQLAEWLEELKERRETNFDYVSLMDKRYYDGYNKAINKFVEQIKEVYPFTILELEQFEEIAEQLKKGKEE